MSANGELRPIIIKKKKIVGGDGHHGGAWKVAYADFVTAMMAFFLLMWLLNATSEEQRKGLADYFNPVLPISRTSAGGAGMLAGDTIFSEETSAGTAPEGVPPKPNHNDAGPPLGEEAAMIDEQQDAPEDASSSAASSGNERPEGALLELGSAGLGAAGLDGEDLDAERLEEMGIAATASNSTLEIEGDAEARAIAQAEQERLEAVGERVAKAMREAENGALQRHFFLRITPEGLVIEIIDVEDQPLLASASAKPAPILSMLVDVLVPVLGETTNDIAVVGHTDAVPFGGVEYSNWELSADRANAARRMLTGRGLPETRIKRVTGKAAVEPLVADASAAQNRRIAITLLRNHPR
jgi:chemotaxis protein MotB